LPRLIERESVARVSVSGEAQEWNNRDPTREMITRANVPFLIANKIKYGR
jgi:hypothetical protein